ncbi:MAG: peptidylprolyl isomerase [Clostridiales bacterium]|nr:peptidylprolyl isomerase [Clostridiales bacterium]
MRFTRTVLASVVAVALFTGVAACGSEDIAARVNGEEITRAELDAQVERLRVQYGDMFEGENGDALLLDFQRSLLASMIDAILMRKAAEERGISVTDAEIDEQVEGIKAGIEDFDAALTEANMTLEDLRDQLRDQLVAQKLIEEIAGSEGVTAEEIAAYYEENTDQFTEAAATNAAHILFDAADKATAERVLAEIRAGGDFAALAKEHSKDGSGANGGDLGWADPNQYVPQFKDALGKLEEGEVSDLVESEFGWHIIKLLGTREASVQPLTEVTTLIEQMILQDRNTEVFQEFVAELRAAAEIEYVIPELEQTEAPAGEAPAGE